MKLIYSVLNEALDFARILESGSVASIPCDFWIEGWLVGGASRSGRFALEKHLLLLPAIDLDSSVILHVKSKVKK
jgi:hypothetical protein